MILFLLQEATSEVKEQIVELSFLQKLYAGEDINPIFYTIIGGIIVFIVTRFGSSIVSYVSKLYKSRFNKEKKEFKFAKNSIEDYFTMQDEKNEIDVFCYQFGLRPKLPIIDVLYLELLKKKIIEGRIRKLVIFPTLDKSTTSQNVREFEEFQENINTLFCEHADKITFIDPRSATLTNKALTDKEFIDSLYFLGTKDFYDYINESSSIGLKSIADFNILHPKDSKILTLITHIFKAWDVRDYLLNHLKSSGSEKMNIGFVFWEVEFDKWGIYKRIAERQDVDKVTLFIGKTIYSSVKSKEPLVVFLDDALSIFEDKAIILEKVSKIDNEELNIIIGILITILRDNYSLSFDKKTILEDSKEAIDSLITGSVSFGRVYNEIKESLSDEEKVLFNLIIKLRAEYQC